MSAVNFNNSYASLPEVFYTKQKADPAPAPSWIKTNDALAKKLGIDVSFLNSNAGLDMLSGRAVTDGSYPLAMVYAGHQFGGWSPRLGDGRALLLGEVIGTDNIRYDIQLKGSGRTPYSRGGDGKAAVGPVIREYIVSEAMAALGVPTTRALAAVTTGEDVIRETRLPGAILTRVAQSHIRVGTFQYFYAQNDKASLKTLADYVIDRHYPKAHGTENPIQAMYNSIVTRQAKLIALWMKYGFIHGVMNTDNCQIAGETIDYGPCAYMDTFHPMKVFSSIDEQGRYAWGKQPHLAHWNLSRLGEALMPIWGKDDDTTTAEISTALDTFSDTFNENFYAAFAQKLGLPELDSQSAPFLETTFETMTSNKIDFTLFFAHLRRSTDPTYQEKLINLFETPEAAGIWLGQWDTLKAKSGISANDSQTAMDTANPIYIARNHRVEEAIQAGLQGNYEPMNALHDILQNPFTQQDGAETYEAAPEATEIVQQTFCGT
ncbi:YdiU family protein [Amylibacter sp. SFDW26]|uniref:protein adenylyltransferase SelO n=1 Tax=Amylibacter sp. SFDW26 TaxID=2652722 RepID=UPI00126196E1|nr:YdiU family protein [Amylibacter sp. SFDW26]KAB7616322.1 YdiU family protein [Amylibacter sp. SFDW26]